MFLPIGDKPNPKNFTPWVNYSLIAINVLVYLGISLPLSFSAPDMDSSSVIEVTRRLRSLGANELQLKIILDDWSAYNFFVGRWGFKPGAPEINDLFASMFLHAGFMHLAGNMLFLWIYGDNVEHRLGRLGYIGAYLLSGVAAALLHAVLDTSSLIPMVGASGAISGVLGLYFFLFPANQVQVLFIWFPFLIRKFYIGARWVLGAFVVVDNLLPMAIGASSGVAYGAHIGGFIFGLIAAGCASWFVTRPKAREGLPKAEFHMKMAQHRMSQGHGVSAYQHLEKAIRLDASLEPRARAMMAEIDI